MTSPATTSEHDRLDGSIQRQPFVSVADAKKLLHRSPSALFIDARARRQYGRGHLPGALHLPARELNPVEDGVRKLVAREELLSRLGRAGSHERLVVYGDRGGADAAHLWWTMRAHDLGPVWLLDGGIEAWQAEGEPLEQEPADAAREAGPNTDEVEGISSGEVSRENGSSRITEPLDSLVAGAFMSAEELLGRLDDPNLAIVDTREPEEYTGEMSAARFGGHIPGASLFSWTRALDSNLRLRPESELRELLARALEKPEVVVYCQSGVRAAHTLAVLQKLGHPRPRLYLGSWGEWGNREDTPVEVEVAE